jgi:transcription termination/antitermination protein NusG
VTEQSETNPEVVHEGAPAHEGVAAHTGLPAQPDHELQDSEMQDSKLQDSGQGGSDQADADHADADQASLSAVDDKPQAAAEPVASKPAAAPRAKAAKSKKAAPAEPVEEVPKSENMNWYILKVQSNREESIREGLLRRVSIQGLGRFFGEVIVPTEKITEVKGGKKRVIKRKLYPGYIVVHMEINEDTWFLVRETPGIGDFTGASGVPSVMQPHEVERIIAKQEEKSDKTPDLKIPFTKGDRVKVIEGNFASFEGEVDAIDKTNGRVTVMVTIFNRTTPVEFEYWQVELV